MSSNAVDKDGLDKLIAFLQKREGIDKTLKLLRYTARLIAAVSPKGSETHQRYSAFEKSVGVSRKAFRLGKFLQDYNNLRKSRSLGVTALLELVAWTGEGIYFFIEQFVWLIKAGALDKSNEEQLAQLSAWSEFIGYMANIWISLIKIRALNAELTLVRAKAAKEGGTCVSISSPATATASGTSTTCNSSDARSTSAQSSTMSSTTPAPPPALSPVLRELRLRELTLLAARRVRVRAIVQDLADSTLALNDIRGGRDKLLGHPVTLAVAGLVSGVISAHKNWIS